MRLATDIGGDIPDYDRNTAVRASIVSISVEYILILDDLVLCYRILYNLVDVEFDMFFFQLASSTTRRKRGHCKKLCKPLCNAFIAGTYWHRVINIWNALPDTVVTAPTVYFIQETFMSR